MNEWAFTDDPVELRIRLEVALEHIAVLEAENAELKARTPAPWPPPGAPAASLPGAINSDAAVGGVIPSADHASPPEVKIALFRALFAGRQDVYAHRWTSRKTGKSGWSPAERDPFGAKDRPESERCSSR